MEKHDYIILERYLASGKWILTKHYIMKSAEKGKWLNPGFYVQPTMCDAVLKTRYVYLNIEIP